MGREGEQRGGEKEGEGGDERDHSTVQSSSLVPRPTPATRIFIVRNL